MAPRTSRDAILALRAHDRRVDSLADRAVHHHPSHVSRRHRPFERAQQCLRQILSRARFLLRGLRLQGVGEKAIMPLVRRDTVVSLACERVQTLCRQKVPLRGGELQFLLYNSKGM